MRVLPGGGRERSLLLLARDPTQRFEPLLGDRGEQSRAVLVEKPLPRGFGALGLGEPKRAQLRLSLLTEVGHAPFGLDGEGTVRIERHELLPRLLLVGLPRQVERGCFGFLPVHLLEPAPHRSRQVSQRVLLQEPEPAFKSPGSLCDAKGLHLSSRGSRGPRGCTRAGSRDGGRAGRVHRGGGRRRRSRLQHRSQLAKVLDVHRLLGKALVEVSQLRIAAALRERPLRLAHLVEGDLGPRCTSPSSSRAPVRRTATGSP